MEQHLMENNKMHVMEKGQNNPIEIGISITIIDYLPCDLEKSVNWSFPLTPISKKEKMMKEMKNTNFFLQIHLHSFFPVNW